MADDDVARGQDAPDRNANVTAQPRSDLSTRWTDAHDYADECDRLCTSWPEAYL